MPRYSSIYLTHLTYLTVHTHRNRACTLLLQYNTAQWRTYSTCTYLSLYFFSSLPSNIPQPCTCTPVHPPVSLCLLSALSILATASINQARRLSRHLPTYLPTYLPCSTYNTFVHYQTTLPHNFAQSKTYTQLSKDCSGQCATPDAQHPAAASPLSSLCRVVAPVTQAKKAWLLGWLVAPRPAYTCLHFFAVFSHTHTRATHPA